MLFGSGEIFLAGVFFGGQSGGFCLVVVQLVAVVLAAHRSSRTASAKPSACLGAAAAHADGDFDLLPELCCAAESAALPGAAADAQRNGSPENIDQNAKATSRPGPSTRSCSRSVACTWLAASKVEMQSHSYRLKTAAPSSNRRRFSFPETASIKESLPSAH